MENKTQKAAQMAHDIIQSMRKYKNFRDFWNRTERKEVILRNICTVIIDHLKDPPKLDWEQRWRDAKFFEKLWYS